MSILGLKKNRRFVIFRRPFWSILTENVAIRIYRKTGPTKSTVLGPRPPPWEIYKFYRILPFFIDFGVFNRAGKTVSKIGIYALPPLKREIYWFFINSRPNFVPYTILFDHYPLQNWLLFIYRSLVLFTLGEKPNSFSLFVGRTYVAWGIVPLGYQSTTNQ
jgi:hypothetical protein